MSNGLKFFEITRSHDDRRSNNTIFQTKVSFKDLFPVIWPKYRHRLCRRLPLSQSGGTQPAVTSRIHRTGEILRESGASSRNPRILAIGSGKGGVGKSVVTANLAIALAQQGKKCAILDADLGGANQHTILGMQNPSVSLADLFSRTVPSLQKLLLPSPIPNLWLISSGRAQLDMANPKHALKEKVIRQLRTLDMDYVLIDLGAGSTFNVLDFFLAAHERIVVVVPVPTAIENAYHFLKAAYFRGLKGAIKRAGAARVVDKAMEEKVVRGIRSPKDLLTHIAAMNPAAGAIIERQIAALAPKLIINQVQQTEELKLGRKMVCAYGHYFGVPAEFLGAIRSDDRVSQAIRMKQPVLEAFPQSAFSQTIRKIVMESSLLVGPPQEKGKLCTDHRQVAANRQNGG
jgi:flagellar biosynthesis protein FlhG